MALRLSPRRPSSVNGVLRFVVCAIAALIRVLRERKSPIEPAVGHHFEGKDTVLSLHAFHVAKALVQFLCVCVPQE